MNLNYDNISFMNKLTELSNKINQRLLSYISIEEVPEKTVIEAMKYSVEAGGKRIRPVLSLAVCEMLNGSESDVIPYACALEMIHTYSLIHDDLPAMDNDDYRRGRLTSHKVFGEAIAILAGDALLNKAYEIMLEDISNTGDMEKVMAKVRATAIVAEAAGSKGMIAGQVVDMESEEKHIDIDTLRYMHKCKTGALIKASILLSTELLNADAFVKEKLTIYSERIGLAFQIKDDILDVESSLEELGKPTGSDENNKKATYVTIYGLEEAKKLLNKVTEDAIDSLEAVEGSYRNTDFLKQVALFICNRRK